MKFTMLIRWVDSIDWCLFVIEIRDDTAQTFMHPGIMVSVKVDIKFFNQGGQRIEPAE